MALPSPVKTFHTTSYSDISPSRPELSTAGKVVILTGGGSGAGPLLANSYAAAGTLKLAILGRTLKTLQETKATLEASYPGIQILALVVDIVDAVEVDSAFAAAAAAFGPINILVSNAAYLPTPGIVSVSDTQDWVKGYEINVLGALNLLKSFTKHKADTNATVVNVSTAAAHAPAVASMSGYAVSKLASLKLYEYYQAEHPEVTVMNFHPGILDTAMNQKHTAASGYPCDDSK